MSRRHRKLRLSRLAGVFVPRDDPDLPVPLVVRARRSAPTRAFDDALSLLDLVGLKHDALRGARQPTEPGLKTRQPWFGPPDPPIAEPRCDVPAIHPRQEAAVDDNAEPPRSPEADGRRQVLAASWCT